MPAGTGGAAWLWASCGVWMPMSCMIRCVRRGSMFWRRAAARMMSTIFPCSFMSWWPEGHSPPSVQLCVPLSRTRVREANMATPPRAVTEMRTLTADGSLGGGGPA
ncbi:hypothetical protein V8C86DRAFT_2586614 [Haematococcus lacustris]